MSTRQTTRAQQKVMAFLADFIKEHGYAPSTSEMAAHFGCSRSNVVAHLGALERKGLLRRKPGVARAITILGAA